MNTPLSLPTIFRMEKIYFSYNHGPLVLKNVSFNLRQGECLGIIGPNGGGKSTLLKIITGLLSPTQGDIWIQDNPKPVKKGQYPVGTFAYVPQHVSLPDFWPLKVIDLLTLGALRPQWREDSRQLPLKEEYLHLVGLWEKRNQLISSLSGGEKQRALIAKALMAKAKIMVLDEPNTGLDSTGQDQMYKILDKLKKEHGTAIIIVDHNIQQVIQHSEQLLCLNQTSHWHDHKEMLTKEILESIYHCEFEHLLIHQRGGQGQDHYPCEDEYHNHSQSFPAPMKDPPIATQANPTSSFKKNNP